MAVIDTLLLVGLPEEERRDRQRSRFLLGPQEERMAADAIKALIIDDAPPRHGPALRAG
jgi:hypothetical protein